MMQSPFVNQFMDMKSISFNYEEMMKDEIVPGPYLILEYDKYRQHVNPQYNTIKMEFYN